MINVDISLYAKASSALYSIVWTSGLGRNARQKLHERGGDVSNWSVRDGKAFPDVAPLQRTTSCI